MALTIFNKFSIFIRKNAKNLSSSVLLLKVLLKRNHRHLLGRRREHGLARKWWSIDGGRSGWLRGPVDHHIALLLTKNGHWRWPHHGMLHGDGGHSRLGSLLLVRLYPNGVGVGRGTGRPVEGVAAAIAVGHGNTGHPLRLLLLHVQVVHVIGELQRLHGHHGHLEGILKRNL